MNAACPSTPHSSTVSPSTATTRPRVRIRLSRRAFTPSTLIALSGIACVALLLVARWFAGSQPPALNTPPHLVRAFYALHRTPIGLATYLAALALASLLCFVSALETLLARGRRERALWLRLALAGGVGAVCIGLVADLFLATLAFRASSMNTETAWILFTLWNMALAFAYFPAAILVGSVSVVILQDRVFPRALGLCGLPLAVACLVTGTAAHHTTGPLVYGGDYRLPLAGAFLLWVLLISVTVLLIGRPSESDPSAEGPHADSSRKQGAGQRAARDR